MTGKGAPKKTTNISARVPDNLKESFRESLAHVGFTEAFFVRACAEALIHHKMSGEDLVLPVRLQTVQRRDTLKKKKL